MYYYDYYFVLNNQSKYCVTSQYGIDRGCFPKMMILRNALAGSNFGVNDK